MRLARPVPPTSHDPKYAAAAALAAGLALGPACSCEGDAGPPRFAYRELFRVAELNTSRKEVHRYSPRRTDTLFFDQEAREEVVTLSSQLDLIVVLDKSASMERENEDFLHPMSRQLLDTLGAGAVADVDLQVRFLGPSAGGEAARLSFGDLVLRRDLRDSFTTGPGGERIYRYPRVREYIQRKQGFASDAELQEFLEVNDPAFGDPTWARWDAEMIPPVLGSPAFDLEQGAESLVEWFELHTRHVIGGGSQQGFLFANVLRYLQTRPDGPEFPRRTSLIAVLLVTDDQEDRVIDLAGDGEVRWEDYANDTCPGGQFPAQYDSVQDCKRERYAREGLAAVLEEAANPNVRFFGVTCSDVFAPTNGQCALTEQAIAAGQAFRPPYRLLTELTSGGHAELPATGDDGMDRERFQAVLDDFAERISFEARRRISLAAVPYAASVRLTHAGSDLPRVTPGSAAPKGFVCADPRGPALCQELELVGYSPAELPLDATITARYVVFRGPGDAAIASLPLSATPDPSTLEVRQGGLRLSPTSFTYDAATNRVDVAGAGRGVLRADYLVDPAQPARSFMILLDSLPHPAPIMVRSGGALLPECEPDVEDAEKRGCFELRPWRAIEVWRDDRDGVLRPAESDLIEIVYAEVDRFADPIREVSRTLYLAEEPASVEQLSVFVAGALPPELELSRDGAPPATGGVRADPFSAFTALDPSAWSYNPVARSITLATLPAYGAPVLVTYELAPSPAALRSAPSTEALSPDRLAELQALQVYKASCLGPNGAGPVMETVREGVDRTTAERVVGATIGGEQATLDGPARPVTGMVAHPDLWLHEGLFDPTCDDEDRLASTVMLARSHATSYQRDYPLAFCLAMRSAERCATTGQTHQLGHLLVELTRHGPAILTDASDAERAAQLRIAIGIFEEHLGGDAPQAAMANLAYALLLEARLDPALEAENLARARGLVHNAAVLANNAVFWDLYALWLDTIFDDPLAMKEAARRAAALDPHALSLRGRPVMSAAGGGCGGGGSDAPTTGDQGGGCDNEAGSCDRVKCELVIMWYMGVHPAVQIGKAVQNATEYAICELLTGGCEAACARSGEVSGGCYATGGLDGVDDAGDLLDDLTGGGWLEAGFGLDGDGNIHFSASVNADVGRNNGLSVGGGVKGYIPTRGESGGGGLSAVEITEASAGVEVSGPEGWGGGSGTINVGVSYDAENCSGKVSFGGGGNHSPGVGHSASPFNVNGPDPRDGASSCGG